MMCDCLRDFIISVVGGLLSAIIVSVVIKKLDDKAMHKRQFEYDKQIYCRYIQSIHNELVLAYKTKNYTFLSRAINDWPIRESFDNLSEKSVQTIETVEKYLNDLKFITEEKKVTEIEYEEYCSKLLKCSFDILLIKEKK